MSVHAQKNMLRSQDPGFPPLAGSTFLSSSCFAVLKSLLFISDKGLISSVYRTSTTQQQENK